MVFFPNEASRENFEAAVEKRDAVYLLEWIYDNTVDENVMDAMDLYYEEAGDF